MLSLSLNKEVSVKFHISLKFIRYSRYLAVLQAVTQTAMQGRARTQESEGSPLLMQKNLISLYPTAAALRAGL